jgi:hypothetical protein
MAAPAAVAAQEAPRQPIGALTDAQAQSGRAIYNRNCAGCHGVNFEGSGDAPSLAGGTFMLKWGPKMVSELFGEILQTMPPANPGSLGELAALNATAYILQRNGAQTGHQALTPGATTPIGAVAIGRAHRRLRLLKALVAAALARSCSVRDRRPDKAEAPPRRTAASVFRARSRAMSL